MPPLLVRGVKEALKEMRGPIVLISNLLTEGSGMEGFTAADADDDFPVRHEGRTRHH